MPKRAEAAQAEAYKRAVLRAAELIDESASAPSLSALAREAGMSRHHFHRTFKALLGITPKDYIRAKRALSFGRHLRGGAKVTDAFFEAGFGSSTRAYAESAALGMTPKQLQRQGAGEVIRFAIGKTPLGLTLVAKTAKGLCMTGFGSDKKQLIRDMHARFARAEFLEDKNELAPWLKKVARFLTAPGDRLDLPLDLRGTAFQARVWRLLQKIPPGTTLSYKEVAKALRQPRAVRAVASACGRNPVALFVPCHRVVQSGGGLGGYRWGVKRKRALLKLEQEYL